MEDKGGPAVCLLVLDFRVLGQWELRMGGMPVGLEFGVGVIGMPWAVSGV